MKTYNVYFTDPCYPISNEHWDRVIDETDFLQNDTVIDFEFGKVRIVASSTSWGDGSYTSEIDDSIYYVDTGTIGVLVSEIPISINKNYSDDFFNCKGAKHFTIQSKKSLEELDIEADRDHNGVISLKCEEHFDKIPTDDE